MQNTPRVVVYWVLAGIVASAILPWHNLDNWILSAAWFKTFPTGYTAPALYQGLRLGHAWLLPALLPLGLIALLTLGPVRRRLGDDARIAQLLIGLSIAGLNVMAIQGFAIIHSGVPNFSVTAGQWYRVSFDAATAQEGQPINVVVRRGGGGSAGYEYLMPSAEAFAGSTAWRRYSFTFQATKTVIAGDPLTQEHGARVDFERNQPDSVLSVARLEMVTLTPAQAALQIKLLLNANSVATSIDCASLGVPSALCNFFVHMDDSSAVGWPAPISPLTGRPTYTRDTSLTDSDGDGIADQQDACPNTPAGLAVNARGCAISQ